MGETETDSEPEVGMQVNKEDESDVEAEQDYAEFKKTGDTDKHKGKSAKKSKNAGKHRRGSDKGQAMEVGGASEKVKVIVRCRPLSEKEILQGHTRIVQIAPDNKALEVHRPNPSSSNLVNAKVDKMFTFDAVYDERTSQSQLYEEAFKDLIDSVLEGFNGTIFAYGQTASGKTYTMEGIREIREHQGVIPNAFRHIFSRIQESPNMTYLVSASYLEIYNEEVKDLLSPKLKICELKENSSGGGVHVKGLTNFLCRDFDEINNLMTTGNKNRSVGATNMNEHSSRSHAVFMISVEMSEEWANGETHVKVGHLNLVDLAGSERQGKTGAEGDRLKEAVKINLSLSALGNVIGALADGKNGHIPYRDSKLTRLLQNSLGGNARTIMVATIGPASYNYDETVVTLRYASRAKRIKNKPKINEDPKDAMLRNYQQEIAKLRSLLEAKMSRQLDGGSSDEGSGSESAQKRHGAGSRSIFDNSLLKELEPYLDSSGAPNDPKDVLKILTEKRKLLLSDTATVKEEKERLISKLESTHRKVEQAQEECSELHARIEWFQSKVLNGDKNLLDHTKEQQKLIEQRQLELDEEKVKEDQIRQKIEEHDLGVVELKEIGGTIESQNHADQKKVNKMEAKVAKWRIERQERVEKHSYEVSRIQRYFVHSQKENELQKSVSENFVPPKVHGTLASLAHQNDDESFNFMPITSIPLPRPKVNRMTLFPFYIKSSTGIVEPKTNFHYTDENILQLQPIPPLRVTKRYVPPDTDPHIKSVMERALAEAEKDVVIDCSRSGPQTRRRVKTARVRLGEVLTFENNWTVRQVLSAKHRSKEIPYKDFVAVKRPNEREEKSFAPLKTPLRRVNHVSLSPNLSLVEPLTESCLLDEHSVFDAPAYQRHCSLHNIHESRPRTCQTENMIDPVSLDSRLEVLDKMSSDLTISAADELRFLKMDEIYQKNRFMSGRLPQGHRILQRPGSSHVQNFARSQPPRTAIPKAFRDECQQAKHASPCNTLTSWVNDITRFDSHQAHAPPPTANLQSFQQHYNKQQDLPFRRARHVGSQAVEECRGDAIRAHTNYFPPQTAVTVTSPHMRRSSTALSHDANRSGSSDNLGEFDDLKSGFSHFRPHVSRNLPLSPPYNSFHL